jgi:peroxiredoxin
MKNLLLTWMLALAAASVFAQAAADTTATDTRGYLVKPGDKAPADFQLVYADGRKTTLKELRGKIVVLQFTASWCKVCRAEMPHLEQDVWQAYKDKDFVLIGVDRDEPLEKVKKFQQDIGVTYPLALDPGADIFGRFAAKKAGVTRNVVIDKKGNIVFLTRLYNPEEFKEMVKVIDELVKG